MAIEIELPPDLEVMLRADAEAQGRTMEEVAAERLTALYRAASVEAITEDAADRERLADFAAERSRPKAELAVEVCSNYGLSET